MGLATNPLATDTLRNLASSLRDQLPIQACVIKKVSTASGRTYSVELPSTGKRIIGTLVSFLRKTPQAEQHLAQSREELSQTVHFFEKAFGKSRFQNALRNAEIKIAVKQDFGQLLSYSEIETLFAHLAQVSKEDLQELLDEIHSTDNKNVRFFKGDALAALRAQFSGKTTISACTTNDIDRLFEILLPFENPDHLFFKNNALLEPSSKFALSSPQMHRYLAHSLEVLRHTKAMTVPEWEIYFAKKISSPYLRPHLLVRHPQGYLHLTNTIEGKGISKLIFEPLGTTELATHVLYRGTRGFQPSDTLSQAVDTIREDFTHELGATGVMATYDKTKEVLIGKRDICLIGFSLGGAHAQRDALLFTDQVRKVVSVNAPGIDAKSADLLPQILRSVPGRTPLEIVCTSDSEDLVDTAGERHLGAGCTREIAHISIRGYLLRASTDQQQNPFEKPIERFCQMGVVSTVQSVAKATFAHVRPTFIFASHLSEVLDNSDRNAELVQKYLMHDREVVPHQCEKIRKDFSRNHLVAFSDFVKQRRPDLNL